MNKRLGTLIAALFLVSLVATGGDTPTPKPVPCQLTKNCAPPPTPCGGPGQQPCPQPKPSK